MFIHTAEQRRNLDDIKTRTYRNKKTNKYITVNKLEDLGYEFHNHSKFDELYDAITEWDIPNDVERIIWEAATEYEDNFTAFMDGAQHSIIWHTLKPPKGTSDNTLGDYLLGILEHNPAWKEYIQDNGYPDVAEFKRVTDESYKEYAHVRKILHESVAEKKIPFKERVRLFNINSSINGRPNIPTAYRAVDTKTKRTYLNKRGKRLMDKWQESPEYYKRMNDWKQRPAKQIEEQAKRVKRLKDIENARIRYKFNHEQDHDLKVQLGKSSVATKNADNKTVIKPNKRFTDVVQDVDKSTYEGAQYVKTIQKQLDMMNTMKKALLKQDQSIGYKGRKLGPDDKYYDAFKVPDEIKSLEELNPKEPAQAQILKVHDANIESKEVADITQAAQEAAVKEADASTFSDLSEKLRANVNARKLLTKLH